MGFLGNLFSSAVTGNWIGAGASVLSGLIGGVSSNNATKKTNETNLQIARENNQTSIDLARENNAWQAAQNELAFNREQQAAWEMFNAENKYNSPIEQLKRYQAAGINPSVAFGGSLGSANSAAASGQVPSYGGVSPSMPTLSTPTMQTPPTVMSGVLGGLEQLANVFKSVGEAKKAGAETKTLENTLDGKVRQLELSNSIAEWQDWTNRNIVENKLREETNEVAQRVNNLMQDAANAVAQHDYIVAQTAVEEAKKELTESQTSLNKSEKKWKDRTLNVYIRQLESQIEANKASAEESRSQVKINEKTKNLITEQVKKQKINNISDLVDALRKLDGVDKTVIDAVMLKTVNIMHDVRGMSFQEAVMKSLNEPDISTYLDDED